ncbi:MAG: metallophosphoesterase family protein [Natrialbaceae archaeon]|nr:metallophosphoesterase family protein [Natrialbaceae archaeon]
MIDSERRPSRREFLKYAGVGGTGVAVTTGIATYHHWHQSGIVDTDGTTGLIATWQRDPTTTMTIDWHAMAHHEAEPVLEYAPTDTDDWREVSGEGWPFPNTTRTVQRVELTGLSPDTRYDVRLPEFDEEFSIRTMPTAISPDDPLLFATGGDTMHAWQMLRQTNEVVRAYDLDFIQWGGDLAYADASPYGTVEWFDWFAVNKHTLIRDDDRLIPIVVGIGNHETAEGYVHDYPDYEQTADFRSQMAPYFYDLFAFPGQPGYGVLDFGDYLSLVVLDSGHTNPLEGTQTDWLADRLAERTDVDHLIPSYHVPAYPSHRNFDGRVSTQVRDLWVPLLEAHGVSLALEHHEHLYHRTVPIRNGEPAADGIVFMGDGAWGTRLRAGDQTDRWYVDEHRRKRHAMVCQLDGSTVTVEAIDGDRTTFDRFEV